MKSVIFVMALLLPVCQSLADTTLLIANSAFPKPFQSQLGKDVELKTVDNLLIENLSLQAKVKGKVQQSSFFEDGGFWYSTIAFGASVPAECYSFTEFDGVATSLNTVVQNAVEIQAQTNQLNLLGSFNHSFTASVVDNRPYIGMSRLYKLGETSATASGIVKGYSAQVGDILHICLHNEVGYTAAFKELFESFIRSIEQSSVNAPLFSQVISLRINAMAVGFISQHYSKDEDGDFRIITRSNMLIPADAQSMVVSDEYQEEWSSPNGDLINATSYSITNGELMSYLSISAPEGVWVVNGQIQGKAYSATMDNNAPIHSSYGQIHAIRNMLSSAATEAELNTWVASANPGNITNGNITRASAEDIDVVMSLGPIEMQATVNPADGTTLAGSIAVGQMNMQLEESVRTGQLP